jgi:para-nitrobenzyl esterase
MEGMHGSRGRALLALVAVVAVVASTFVAVGAGAATAPATAATDCSVTSRSSKLVVATDRGAVRGARADGVRSWKGIPYAAAPIGKRRWRAPAPHACWTNVRAAKEFGSPCPQVDSTSGAVVGKEDCLTLNVWRPDAGTKRRPVMVFIHGGGHSGGSTSQVNSGVTLYDGTTMAKKGDAVVVTVEYRLGALGWLAADALKKGKTPPGNYGLLDEIAALKWVKANIARFGGDPARVLVFGESAGAVDTCLLLTSPKAKGLFNRAGIESGACVAADPTDALRSATTFVEASGCQSAKKVAKCLRALPTETVLRTAPPTDTGPASLGKPKYGPYVDGRILPAPPLERIASGKASHLPVIVGSNEDETAIFVRDVQTADEYATNLANSVGQAATQRILEVYPVTDYESPLAAMIAVTTDATFTCSARNTVRALVEGQTQPVFRYYYTHTAETGPLRFLGAFHGAELFYVFGQLGTNNATPSAAEQELSDTMIGYWSRFAATGDPNGGGAPEWPAAKKGADPFLQLDTPPAAGDGVRTAQCDLWSTLRGS